MNIECPKCGYVRTQRDDPAIPTTVCPKCCIIYKKFKQHSEVEKTKRTIESEPQYHSIIEEHNRSFFKKPFSWLFGLCFSIAGIMAFMDGEKILGYAGFAIGLILLPATEPYLFPKSEIPLSTSAKSVLIIIVLVIASALQS